MKRKVVGRVKSINESQGYAIITDSRGRKIVVPLNQIRSSTRAPLTVGARVFFSYVRGRAGNVLLPPQPEYDLVPVVRSPLVPEGRPPKTRAFRKRHKYPTPGPQIAGLFGDRRLTATTVPLTLVLNDPTQPIAGLSAQYLADTILPYIRALITIQHIIDEIQGRPLSVISILAIRSGSVSLDLTGGIRDTVELVLDNVVPWRRENHKRLKQHEADLKAAEVDEKRAEVDQVRAKSEPDRRKAEADAELARAKAREQELLNLKLELELKELALQMARRLAPDRTTDEQLQLALRLYDPTHTLVASPLEVSSVEVLESQI